MAYKRIEKKSTKFTSKSAVAMPAASKVCAQEMTKAKVRTACAREMTNAKVTLACAREMTNARIK